MGGADNETRAFGRIVTVADVINATKKMDQGGDKVPRVCFAQLLELVEAGMMRLLDDLDLGGAWRPAAAAAAYFPAGASKLLRKRGMRLRCHGAWAACRCEQQHAALTPSVWRILVPVHSDTRCRPTRSNSFFLAPPPPACAAPAAFVMQRLRQQQRRLGVTAADADLVMLGTGCSDSWAQYLAAEKEALDAGLRESPAARLASFAGTTFSMIRSYKRKAAEQCFSVTAIISLVHFPYDHVEQWCVTLAARFLLLSESSIPHMHHACRRGARHSPPRFFSLTVTPFVRHISHRHHHPQGKCRLSHTPLCRLQPRG